MAYEFAQEPGGVLCHAAEDDFVLCWFQLPQERDRIVRSQQGEHASDLLLPAFLQEILQDASSQVGFHLHEGIGCSLVVHHGQDVDRVIFRKPLKRIGYIWSLLSLKHACKHGGID
jgi:hypothetical protein